MIFKHEQIVDGTSSTTYFDKVLSATSYISGNLKARIVTLYFENSYESLVISEESYLLNDNGKTIEIFRPLSIELKEKIEEMEELKEIGVDLENSPKL